MRDVIQVERVGGPGGLAELARVADELLPPLVARLGVSELGEIEVRHGDWRVRVRRAPVAASPPPPPVSPAAASAPAPASRDVPTPSASSAASADTHHPVATAPAVGYFGVRGGLAVGLRVTRGDVIGWVDVLGVRRDIVAPADGIVERLLVEPGDPVEYGQGLMAIIPPHLGGAATTSGTGTTTDVEDGPA